VQIQVYLTAIVQNMKRLGVSLREIIETAMAFVRIITKGLFQQPHLLPAVNQSLPG